jgi:HD-like signal output (HDOD) protein
LLHDLGHVYLLDEIGEPYAAYLLEPVDPERGLERERQLTQTDHEDVGAIFAYDWNLPPAVARVLHEHHESEPNSLPAIVNASDWLVRELNNPSAADQDGASEGVDRALAAIGVDRARWAAAAGGVRDEYAELLTLFDAVAA